MLTKISRAQAIGGWIVAMAAIAAYSVVAGAAVSLGNAALLSVACLVPPAIMLLVWQGPPPLTVAELLYAVNESPRDGRS